MKQRVKRLLFGSERQIRIKLGIAKGLIMNINPENKSLRIVGLDETEIALKFREYSVRSDVFIDIGASDGYYGLIFKKFNPSGLAILFDAQEKFLAEQKKNLNINGFHNKYELHAKYVSDINADNAIALDNLFESKRISKEKIFLKIDVDGGELSVLKGIEKTLAKFDCRLIIETHSVELEKSCTKFLQNLNYNTTIINNAWWRVILPERRPIEHNRWFYAEK